MSKSQKDPLSLAFNYLEIRKTIGYLGFAFPFILLIGGLIFFNTGLQSSISAYYHTGMQNVFVAVLSVIAFFLLSYRGYDKTDKIAGDLACVFALGVAFIPTKPDILPPNYNPLIGYAHIFFAGAFFLTLAYFSIFLFIKTDDKRKPTYRKVLRNRVYRICGILMLVSILFIAVFMLLPDYIAANIEPLKPVYWLEAIAILSFGVSWFTKGEAILGDEL